MAADYPPVYSPGGRGSYWHPPPPTRGKMPLIYHEAVVSLNQFVLRLRQLGADAAR